MADERIGVSIEVEDKFTQAFNQLNSQLDVMNKNLEKVKDQTEKSNSSMDRFAKGAVSAAGALGGFIALKSMIEDFKNAEQAQNKLTTAFNNNKGGIGLTRKELEELGKTLEDKSLFSGEAIAAVQAKFISFGNIGGEAFKRASQTALDLSAALGQDATSAANMLGKALSNPAEGLSALKKAGIDFNKEQEIMIAKMVEQGHVTQAQSVILTALEEKYKGQAEAQRQGAGILDVVTQKTGQLAETIGGKLFAVIEPFIKFFVDDIIPMLESCSGSIANLIMVLGSLVVGINGVTFAMSMLTKSNVILLGISLAVWGIVEAIQNWETVSEWISIKLAEWDLLAAKLGVSFARLFTFGDEANAELDKVIAKAQAELDELERAQAERKETARQVEANKVKKAAEDEAAQKLKVEEQFQAKLKEINAQGKKDKAAKEGKEREDEFAKKLKQYDNLSKEDQAFLRDQEKREKVEKTKKLKLDREAYEMLSQGDKDYLDDKAKAQMVHDNLQMKKDQITFRRKEKLMTKFSEDQADYMIAQEKRVTDEKEAMENKKLAIENNIGNARLEATTEMFNTMSQLQSSKTREMFEVGKAAAIGEAIINTYNGISRTIATYPFPISVGMGAAQAALGFSQVQSISSQSFENGGVVGGFMGTTPGRDTTMVNARPGEMYLNARQQRNLFEKIDSNANSLTSQTKTQVINTNYTFTINGNGDESLKKTIKKTISDTEKRTKQKQQFVRGRI